MLLFFTHFPCELPIGWQQGWDTGLDEGLVWPPVAFLLKFWGQIFMAYWRHKMAAWQHIFTEASARLKQVPGGWEIAALQLSWSLNRQNVSPKDYLDTSLDKQTLITEAVISCSPVHPWGSTAIAHCVVHEPWVPCCLACLLSSVQHQRPRWTSIRQLAVRDISRARFGKSRA